MVLCCLCGVEVTGREGAHCARCLQQEVDITEGISRRVHIERCGTCGRYQRPPWVVADLESRELLAVCLKHVRGITKEHKVIDAKFLYTEPHSKELKVKVTVQKEALNNLVMQQYVVVEFRVDDLQCGDCKKSYTKHTWESSVQVRQRAEHRRTLAHLESLILKNKAHSDIIGMEEQREGLDFFFRRHKDAEAFVSFVKTYAVVRCQDSKHLVSQNVHSNSYRFKKTTLVEFCPVCRDDLVYLPPKVAKSLGGLPPLMLCTRAISGVSLLDPATMRATDMSAAQYWKLSFNPVCTHSMMTEFYVLDVIVDGPNRGPETAAEHRGRPRACDVEIIRAVDFGNNDDSVIVRSHLGNVLHPGDFALGFDLRSLNVGIDEDAPGGAALLEVYLVKRKREKDRGKRRHGAKTGDASSVAKDKADSGSDGEGQDDAAMEAAAAQFFGSLGAVDAKEAESGALSTAAGVEASDGAVRSGDDGATTGG